MANIPSLKSPQDDSALNIHNEVIRRVNSLDIGYSGLIKDVSRVLREISTLSNLNKRTEQILNDAQKVNAENKNVQKQIDDLIINSGTSDAEVIQARGDHSLLRGRFEEIENKRADFNFSSNNSQPAKKISSDNSYKVVRKINENELEIYQKTTQGYLRYLYKRNSGGTGYGVDYELLRIVRVEPISDVIVFKNVSTPSVGSVTKTFDFTNDYNSTVTRFFFDGIYADNNVNHYSDKPLTAYTITAGASVTYQVEKPTNKKMNVMFFHRSGQSGNNDVVNVYVNNRLATTIKIDDSFSQNVKRFDIPVYERDTNVNNPLNIRFENTSGNEVYIIGLNVFKLDEYNGEGYDSFLAIGSTLFPFISNEGSSDYAFKNAENGKQFGSYHGGEKSNRCDVLWRPGIRDQSVYVPFDSIEQGKFSVMKNFAIKQIGILIGRAYLHSNQNFNTDGTVQMDFSYQVMPNFEAIPFIDFWSALTCTDVNFNLIRQPIYSNATGQTGHLYFKSTDGFVIQETNSGLQELHSRFTRFNNEFIGTEEASSVSRTTIYNKHYYAPIREWRDESRPIAPEVLQFSKGLDFYVY